MKPSDKALLIGLWAWAETERAAHEPPQAPRVPTGRAAREAFKESHPEIVAERIAAAEAKRARKAAKLKEKK